MPRILVVDDEPGLRDMLQMILRRDGHEVELAADGDEALQLLAADDAFEVLVTDLRMDGSNGIEVLQQVRRKHPHIFVIVMTAFSEWDTAVEAMRCGAYNFIRKPFDNESMRSLVRRACRAQEYHQAASEAGESERNINIIGASEALQRVEQMISQVSTTDSTVLITGPSGTGKELVARSIHYGSLRADGPLVKVNAGALTPTLLESELFGHVKGAFTGAIDHRPGLFELATGGTLFLDEVGELAADTQVKLLRVLESGEYQPVGSRETRQCDVRLVAATNRHLPDMIKAGTFREDLYYRLAIISVELPPLRERTEDIPLIAGHLLARHAVRMRRHVGNFSPEALDGMIRYPWPGNVRELDNRIQRGVALTEEGPISLHAIFGDLGHSGTAVFRQIDSGVTPTGAPGPALEPKDPLEDDLKAGRGIDLEAETMDFQRKLVQCALDETDHNLTEAAKLLGLTFRQIRYKVKTLGLR